MEIFLAQLQAFKKGNHYSSFAVIKIIPNDNSIRLRKPKKPVNVPNAVALVKV
jgi:hypothetical protein